MGTSQQLDSMVMMHYVKTMRAAVYRGKDNVIVEDVPVPEIGEGEVLIRVAACGICGTDIKKIHHGFVKASPDFGA